jgi:hypothetical protein
VANETMRRAQSNLIVIVSRFQDLKYEFSGIPFEKPGDDAEQMIELLDSRLDGGLPISLRACFHWVGAGSALLTLWAVILLCVSSQIRMLPAKKHTDWSWQIPW